MSNLKRDMNRTKTDRNRSVFRFVATWELEGWRQWRGWESRVSFETSNIQTSNRERGDVSFEIITS